MSTAAPALPAAEFDHGAELHAPELYQPEAGTAHSVATLDDIGPSEIAFYREHGYLVVREAFTPADVSVRMPMPRHVRYPLWRPWTPPPNDVRSPLVVGSPVVSGDAGF